MDEFALRHNEILFLCQRINGEISKGELSKKSGDAIRETIKRVRAEEPAGLIRNPRALRRCEQLLEHLQDDDSALPAEQVAKLEQSIQEQLPNL